MGLRAYFDEGGSYRDQRAFGLGGLVGDVAAWKEVVRRWKPALGDVPYFHATDFAASRRAFNGWTPERKQQLLDQLVPPVLAFLQQPASWAFGLAVFTSDYNATIGTYINRQPDPFCLVELLRMLRRHLPADMPPGEQVAVCLESKQGVKGILEDQYNRCRREDDPEKRLGDLSFGDKRRNPELQVADLIVYEVFQGMKRLSVAEEKGESPGTLRPISKLLDESKKCSFRHYEFEGLRQSAENQLLACVQRLQGLNRPTATVTMTVDDPAEREKIRAIVAGHRED